MIKQLKLHKGKINLNSTAGNHLCGLVLGGLSERYIPENFQPRRSIRCFSSIRCPQTFCEYSGPYHAK